MRQDRLRDRVTVQSGLCDDSEFIATTNLYLAFSA